MVPLYEGGLKGAGRSPFPPQLPNHVLNYNPKVFVRRVVTPLTNYPFIVSSLAAYRFELTGGESVLVPLYEGGLKGAERSPFPP